MRSVLIAAAASALLATPAAAQDWKGKGLESLTICEVQAAAVSSGVAVDSLHVFRAGMDADVTVSSDFGDMTLCEAFAEKEAAKLCKKNNRKGRKADTAEFLFSFKRAFEDPAPPPSPCTGPSDPHCFDSATQAFKMESFDAAVVYLSCPELLGR